MRRLSAVLAIIAMTAPAALVAAEGGPSAQGVLKGAEEAQLSSEMPGRIARIAEEGETFHKGDTLVEFACDMLRAEEDMARAAEQGARAQVENQRRLEAVKSAGTLDVAMAEARLTEAQARTRGAAAKGRLCRVVAPYDGVVLKRDAKPHESVNLMAPLLKVARRGTLEITIIAPATWLPQLKPGLGFTFAGATGQKADGKLTRIGAAVDPASQTLELRGEVSGEPAAGLKPGMAGNVVFRAQ
ncbi:MAG TPA: efflux RND transporter periplasmic adaptor subunit [Magnetospirillum sp.]|jgi:RND family efflux transporter MFP subunit|nr:efflux RND transporter periplasmic adaptor subunit [Magnetospirillum sp.]